METTGVLQIIRECDGPSHDSTLVIQRRFCQPLLSPRRTEECEHAGRDKLSVVIHRKIGVLDRVLLRHASLLVLV